MHEQLDAPRLATERLAGRPLLAGDAALAARIWGEPGAAYWLTPDHQPLPAEEIAVKARRMEAHWMAHRLGFYLLFDGATPGRRLDEGRFVGWCGVVLSRIDGEGMAEIGWAMTPEARGLGYATEAATAVLAEARERGFRAMAAYTRPTNQASRRVMEKLGFVQGRRFEQAGHPQVLYEKRPL